MPNEVIDLNYENLLHYAQATGLESVADPAVIAADLLYDYIALSPLNSALSFVFGSEGYFLRKKFDTAVKECWANLRIEMRKEKPSMETTAQVTQLLNTPQVSNENNAPSDTVPVLPEPIDIETQLRERLETTEAQLRETTQQLRITENQLRESSLHYTERLQAMERRLEATEAQLREANLQLGRYIHANNEIDISEINASEIESVVRRLNS